MACTHFGVEKILDEQGEVVGVICPSCGRAARAGDTVWPLYVMLGMDVLLLVAIVLLLLVAPLMGWWGMTGWWGM